MLMKDFIEKQQAEKSTTGRRGAYTKFTGAIKLKDSGLVVEKHLVALSMFKGVSEYHLHNAGRYLVIGIYSTLTKKYSYAVLDLTVEDLTNSDIQIFDYIKEAKEEVAKRIVEDAKVPEAAPAEEVKEDVVVEDTKDAEAAVAVPRRNKK